MQLVTVTVNMAKLGSARGQLVRAGATQFLFSVLSLVRSPIIIFDYSNSSKSNDPFDLKLALKSSLHSQGDREEQTEAVVRAATERTVSHDDDDRDDDDGDGDDDDL